MKLHHPLWTHAAAFAMLIFIAVVLVFSLSVPGEFPVHWGPRDAAGVPQPDRWGAAWELPAATLFFAAMMLVIAIGLDGIWAQSLSRWFNPLCLFDELVVGLMTGSMLAHLARLQGRTVTDGWRLTFLVWTVAVPVAIVLEVLRRARAPEPETARESSTADDARLALEVADKQSRGLRFMYWESQSPGWMRWGFPALGLGFVALGAQEALSGSVRLSSVFAALVGVAMVLSSGGLRVSVNREELAVRIGRPGWRVLRLRLSAIAAAEVHAFNPLKDFGGYGLRRNREMRGYFFQGDRGVKVTTKDERKYLIGSDHPERLALVIEAARRAG